MGFSALFESGEKAKYRGHYRNLLLIACADGGIDDQEQALLDRIASRIGLTTDQVAEIKANPANFPTVAPTTREERYERFIQLMQMVAINGHADANELKLVRKYGIALGFTEESMDEKFELILKHLLDGKSRSEVLDKVL
ncbi:Tellurite resistance protein TerB [Lishizhenia tianjinensis]|uniref:Tellurite resistance protein TerB n=1 Tax=Lishizhenia tianjinensis TaxID=477690 RepID=A0A1I6YXS2_9FLAO|nr:TerB family tellurite resistance protein [Lishizhenia tianjinensis]SFT55340.1 Tellurite resistance protein TerB [Lishizhenia tianjinensis]